MRRLSRLFPRLWADVVGATILALLVASTLGESRGDRSRFLTLLLACVVALALGRAVARRSRAIVPAAVVAICAVAGVAGLVASGPLVRSFDAPLALLALGAVAAGMLAVVRFRVAVKTGTARRLVVAMAVAFAAVLATTVALGATYEPGGRASGSTEHRIALWHGAIEILLDHPTGVGPGRFDDVPPHYLPEGDHRWAENDFLQQGAELGWLGLVTTVLLFAWAFARAWVQRRPDAYVVLGALAVAAVGILASVGHVLHVVAIPIVAAALVGSSQTSSSR